MDKSIAEIAEETRKSWAGKKLWAIVEEADGWVVHQHSPSGVSPSTHYPTKREAIARLMQLLATGPIAPQMHPETACIGNIETLELE